MTNKAAGICQGMIWYSSILAQYNISYNLNWNFFHEIFSYTDIRYLAEVEHNFPGNLLDHHQVVVYWVAFQNQIQEVATYIWRNQFPNIVNLLLLIVLHMEE